MSADSRTIPQFEEALADCRPFGDPDYIRGRLRLHYEHRVRMLSDSSPEARGLTSALVSAPEESIQRVLGDPAVRIAIDRSLDATTPDLEAIIRAAAANLTTPAMTTPPLAERAVEIIRIGVDGWPWVWSEERADNDPLGDLVQREFARGVGELRISTPDSTTREILIEGARLLNELLPRLATSALSHVRTIVVVDEKASPGFTSLTHPQIPEIMFLSPFVLKNPWRAAEYLLHEAMHVKFTDLEHTHSLMSADYDANASAMVHAPWNRAPTPWPINRSLTVMHVYTCLALFFTVVAERRASLAETYDRGGPDPVKQARRSFDRAHYLHGHLARNQEHLDTAGRLLVRWLGGLLRAFDPSPPPEGASAHLFLDLYDRETESVRRLGSEKERWAGAVREVAQSEIRFAYDLLPGEAMALRQHAERLAALEKAGASLAESAEVFVAVRRSVSEALRSTPMDPGPRDAVIRAMVESSGTRLNDLL